MGELICELRKAKAMTQKELAEKLNVTDKAVSKWERGNGYPEITIIPELAKALGITVNELLSGEKGIAEGIELKEEAVVANTISYIERLKKIKASNIFVVISIVFLLGAFVCLLCNYAISGAFDWSLYPTGSIVMVWFVILPIFFMKKHRIIMSMVIITVAIIPYLFLIEYLCPVKGWVIAMAIPITGISVIVAFSGIALFLYTKINRYYVVALNCIIFGVIVNLSVSNIVYNYVKGPENNISVVIVAMSFAVIAVLVFVMGYVKKKSEQV